MISSIISQMRKFGEYYRKNGFLWLCRHIFTNLFSHERFWILEGDINNDIIIQPKIPATIRLLSNTNEDIDRLTDIWPLNESLPIFSDKKLIKEYITRMLSAGHECMIAECQGEIASMTWFFYHNTHECNHEWFFKRWAINPGEVFVADGYCVEKYRGNRLMGPILTAQWDHLSKIGYKKAIVYCLTQNSLSLKNLLNFFEPVKMFYHFRFLGIHIHFMSSKVRMETKTMKKAKD